RFRMSTISARGSVTGARTVGRLGSEKVCVSALEVCDATEADTVANGPGDGAARRCRMATMARRGPSHDAVQPCQSYTNTPRCPLEPPDAITCRSSRK